MLALQMHLLARASFSGQLLSWKSLEATLAIFLPFLNMPQARPSLKAKSLPAQFRSKKRGGQSGRLLPSEDTKEGVENGSVSGFYYSAETRGGKGFWAFFKPLRFQPYIALCPAGFLRRRLTLGPGISPP